jgi:hypothetical protein
MKIRLVFFTIAMLLLPLAGFSLGGADWISLVAPSPAEHASVAATLHTSMVLLIYCLVLNHIVKRRTGKGPLETQRSFYLRFAIASAVTCWLLSYLNLYAASWEAPQDNPWVVQLLLYTPAFALLAPAILITNALLGSFSNLTRSLRVNTTLPAPDSNVSVRILLPLALTGLSAGALWPTALFWLLWISPLLLLICLQLLWHEDTIFSAIKSGDFSRVVFTALSGIIVSNLAAISYQSNASLSINLPDMLLVQSGFVVFGLLCLQLADALQERNATRLNKPPASAALREN